MRRVNKDEKEWIEGKGRDIDEERRWQQRERNVRWCGEGDGTAGGGCGKGKSEE